MTDYADIGGLKGIPYPLHDSELIPCHTKIYHVFLKAILLVHAVCVALRAAAAKLLQ